MLPRDPKNMLVRFDDDVAADDDVEEDDDDDGVNEDESPETETVW